MNNDVEECECMYCGTWSIDPADTTGIPLSDDDASWNKLAKEHTKDCEWVITRAWSRKVMCAD